jgi:hypothetical protein
MRPSLQEAENGSQKPKDEPKGRLDGQVIRRRSNLRWDRTSQISHYPSAKRDRAEIVR